MAGARAGRARKGGTKTLTEDGNVNSSQSKQKGSKKPLASPKQSKLKTQKKQVKDISLVKSKTVTRGSAKKALLPNKQNAKVDKQVKKRIDRGQDGPMTLMRGLWR